MQVWIAGGPTTIQAKVQLWHDADPEQAAVGFTVYTPSLNWQQGATGEEHRRQ